MGTIREAKAEYIHPDCPVTLTVTMSAVDARELLHLCHKVGGAPGETLRGVFDEIRVALLALGVARARSMRTPSGGHLCFHVERDI